MGLKQEYSAGQVQWMNAGRGILHEEMWHTEPWEKTDVEIYQIWVSVEGVSYLSLSFLFPNCMSERTQTKGFVWGNSYY